MHVLRSFRRVGGLLIVGVMGCGGGTEPVETDPTIALVSGNNQSAEVGEAVASPLVVSISSAGSPVAGATVSWSVTGGGGNVDPTSSTTGGNGQASTTWTLGPSQGANTVQASATGVTGSPVTFTATGTVPPPPPPIQADVSVDDNFFDPSTQRIAAGGTVTWTWEGLVDHNVTFSTGPNSPTQASGTFDRTFPTVGSFDYSCTIHGASMSGTITVE